MKIIVCHCTQCKAKKANTRSKSLKKLIKKLTNTKRRKGKEGDVFNFYWA